MWQRKRRRYVKPDQEYYSISNKLKSEGKITSDFEVMLSSLTLEDIIALRLELASRAVDGKLYGLQIWKSIPAMAKEAVLKYAYSASRTKGEAANFLGLTKSDFRKYVKKFNKNDVSCVGWLDGTENAEIRFSKIYEAGIDTNDSVLDVGCGVAHLYYFLENQGWKGEYLGIDPNEKDPWEKNHLVWNILELLPELMIE